MPLSVRAVVGTMAADVIHDGAGIPYAVTTPFIALALVVVFWCWKRAEGTLSIHGIHTRRREWLYWAAVMTTFAFGTAAGDLTAITLNLGYLGSVWWFLAVMAVPPVGWRLGLNPNFAFWMAYIVTRPLGASIADWVGKPVSRTGLGLGDGTVTAVLAALLINMVVVLARRDATPQRDPTARRPRRGAKPASKAIKAGIVSWNDRGHRSVLIPTCPVARGAGLLTGRSASWSRLDPWRHPYCRLFDPSW